MSTAATDTETDIGILLTVALGAFKEGLHAHLAAAGFTDLGPSYGFVFRSLGEQTLMLAELAERLGITPQGALKIVAEMIERGYVKRRDDTDDKRVRRLHLTARGQAALREARTYHAAVERDLIKSLGARQVASARTVLVALSGSASSEGLRAW